MCKFFGIPFFGVDGMYGCRALFVRAIFLQMCGAFAISRVTIALHDLPVFALGVQAASLAFSGRSVAISFAFSFALTSSKI